MHPNKKAGHWGELAAADYLKARGYRILTMNWSCRFGELDIVAQETGYLAFVEVKLRRNAMHGAAREFVTAAKQRRVIAAASCWLGRNPALAQALQPRFDVIELYGGPGRIEHIEHIQNAFTL